MGEGAPNGRSSVSRGAAAAQYGRQQWPNKGDSSGLIRAATVAQ